MQDGRIRRSAFDQLRNLILGALVSSLQVVNVAFANCTGSGEFEPPLRHDEFIHQAYSLASRHERVTLFQIPDSVPESDRVLVILLHGGGNYDLENLFNFMRHTGWSELAEQEGFMLAYPTALNEAGNLLSSYNWNDGRLGTDLWAMPDNENIDDVGYLAEVMDLAQRNYRVGNRIYVMGISNGGMMAFRLASDRRTQSRIGAMTTLVAQVPQARAARPLAAIPTFMIHGTADPLMPFMGGAITGQLELEDGSPFGLPFHNGNVTSYFGTLRRVLKAHACDRENSRDLLPDAVDDGTRVIRFSFCAETEAVQSVVVLGGGHRWQGQGGNTPEEVRPCLQLSTYERAPKLYLDTGLTTLDGFDSTEAAWRFFKQH